MNLHYYKETDSAYISLNEKPGVETIIVVDGVNADVDAEGRLIGIELECASKHLSPSVLEAHGGQNPAD